MPEARDTVKQGIPPVLKDFSFTACPENSADCPSLLKSWILKFKTLHNLVSVYAAWPPSVPCFCETLKSKWTPSCAPNIPCAFVLFQTDQGQEWTPCCRVCGREQAGWAGGLSWLWESWADTCLWSGGDSESVDRILLPPSQEAFTDAPLALTMHCDPPFLRACLKMVSGSVWAPVGAP